MTGRYARVNPSEDVHHTPIPLSRSLLKSLWTNKIIVYVYVCVGVRGSKRETEREGARERERERT